jgi:hypothetical protein
MYTGLLLQFSKKRTTLCIPPLEAPFWFLFVGVTPVMNAAEISSLAAEAVAEPSFRALLDSLKLLERTVMASAAIAAALSTAESGSVMEVLETEPSALYVPLM